MIYSAIGVSDDVDVDDALASVIKQCTKQLEGRVAQAGILFTSLMDVDHAKILTGVLESFSGIELIGCTTDGEIIPGHGYLEDAIALLLLSSETVEFAAAVATNVSGDTEAAFRSAFKSCQTKLESEPALGIILPDGLSTIAVSLDQAIQRSMGSVFPVFGGTAGDSFKLTQTYQFYQDQVYTDGAPLLLFAGGVDIEMKICSGVEPLGPFLSVDRAEKNTIFTLDGKPAAEVYKEFLGAFIEDRRSIQFPLAIYEENQEGFILRDPLTIDKKSGNVVFIGTISERTRARFVAIDRDGVVKSARDATEHIFEHCDRPDIIFIFSCTSRKHTLGTRTKEEFALLLDRQEQIPFFGFHCYGEIGPLQTGGPTLFHNDTYVAVALKARS
ncbi:MAG: hypothetical protein D6B25_15250 [Desulfobulbaceae bacterium]|nr:MAG: hypothetical protein D6B25_15250 [Desulfobulbaceae bacterium]